jgi:hypothetical protein
MQTKYKFEPLPDEVDLARRSKVEKLMRLCPRRAEEFWAKWSAAAFADDEANALLVELTCAQGAAAKPGTTCGEGHCASPQDD